mgnify:FL=1
MYGAIFALIAFNTHISQALVYGLNPAEIMMPQNIQIPANQKLTGMILNPTFIDEYAQLLVPTSVVKKIQTTLQTSPVSVTVELIQNKNNYNVILTAKNSKDKTIASKTFTAITNKNRAKIASDTPYVHTNVKYQMNHGAFTEIKFITQNPFTIPVSIAK